MCIRDSAKPSFVHKYSVRHIHKIFNQVSDIVIKVGYHIITCLLYTSDAADERSSVDLGGRRIIKKKKAKEITDSKETSQNKINESWHEYNKDNSK